MIASEELRNEIETNRKIAIGAATRFGVIRRWLAERDPEDVILFTCVEPNCRKVFTVEDLRYTAASPRHRNATTGCECPGGGEYTDLSFIRAGTMMPRPSVKEPRRQHVCVVCGKPIDGVGLAVVGGVCHDHCFDAAEAANAKQEKP